MENQNNISKTEIIYHYTSGEHFKLILSSGELKVSEFERKNNVKPPALWLSTNPLWEQTATKLWRNKSGVIIPMTMKEQFEKLGLVRFVLPINKYTLCSWAKYKYKSNTPLSLYESMTRSGIKQGANPYEWFAVFKNIPLSDCLAIEKWNGEKWVAL